MRSVLATRFLYPVLFLFAVSIFLVHYFLSGQAVYGDGIGYYAHLRSWVIDGDWNYTNEYKHLYSHENNNSTEPLSADSVQIVATTADGKAENHYSPGVALLLLPFYISAQLISHIVHFFDSNFPVTGYSDLYQILSGIGAISYVVLSLWMLEQVINKTVDDREISKLTTVSIFLATHLLYYGSFDVLNSHFASFFLIILFFYVGMLKKVAVENIFLLGMIAGLLTVNRLQDGILFPLWMFFQQKQTSIKIFLQNALIFCCAFFAALWPLLYHWQHTFSSFLQHTYIKNLERDTASGTIDIFGSFFHPVTGLFTKAPLLLVALLYSLYLIKQKRTEHLVLPALFFAIQTIIITIQGGWFAAAYGGRMYTSSLVLFALVLGQLLLDLKRRNKNSPYMLVALFTAINFASFAYFIFIQK